MYYFGGVVKMMIFVMFDLFLTWILLWYLSCFVYGLHCDIGIFTICLSQIGKVNVLNGLCTHPPVHWKKFVLFVEENENGDETAREDYEDESGQLNYEEYQFEQSHVKYLETTFEPVIVTVHQDSYIRFWNMEVSIGMVE